MRILNSKSNLLDKVEGSNLPVVAKNYFETKLNEGEDPKELTKQFNEVSDKLDKGAVVTRVSEDEGIICQTKDELNDELSTKTKEYNEAKESGNSQRLDKAKNALSKVYDGIGNVITSSIDEVKNYGVDLLNSRNPDAQFKAAITLATDALKSIFGVFGKVGKFLSTGLLKATKAGINLANKVSSKVEDPSVELNEDILNEVNSAIDSKENIEPVTEDEFNNIVEDSDSDLFNNVEKITDWDSAFKYGYAKLQQVHGANYDESIAKKCLEGLKEKYPDNPMVVVGALKYGSKKNKEENSRKIINMRVQRKENSVPGIKLWMQIYPDGSHSESYIVVDEMSESAKILDVYVSPSEPQFDNSFTVGEVIDSIDFSGVSQSRTQNKRQREKVDPETLQLAKDKGVVQLKPNGSWGIISIKAGEWWDANYQSEDSAKAALKAYHASRRNSQVKVKPELWDKAYELIKKLEPNEDEETIQKLISFGFGLAYKPQDFIDTLEEQFSHSTNSGDKDHCVYDSGNGPTVGFTSSVNPRSIIKKGLSFDQAQRLRDKLKRKNNSLTKKFNDFTDSKPALEWLDSLAPNEWGYAYLHVDGKVVGMSFGYDILSQDMDLLYVHSYGLPNRPWETYDIDEWNGRMGEMYDAINETCRKYGEKDDEFRTPNSIHKNPNLKPVHKEFKDAQDAFEWMDSASTPTEDPIATIKIGNKCLDVDYFNDSDTDAEGLRLTMPDGKSQLVYFDDWRGNMGEMFDYINDVCRNSNSRKSNSKLINATNHKLSELIAAAKDTLSIDGFNKEPIVMGGLNPRTFNDYETELGHRFEISPQGIYDDEILINLIDTKIGGPSDSSCLYEIMITNPNNDKSTYWLGKSVKELKSDLIESIKLASEYKYKSRNSNSTTLSQSDLAAAEKYIKQINFSNFREVCKKLAKDLGEDLDLRKFTSEYDMDKFRDYLATRKDISDRLYAAIDYLISSYLGYVGHVKRTSNSRVSNLYQRIKKLADKGWKCIFDTDDGVIEFIRGGELLTIDSGNENLILSGKDIYYVSKDTDKFINELKKYLI
jgi:hypothetical protein